MDSRTYTSTVKVTGPRPALLIAEEPKCGPEAGRNAVCLVCHKQIAQGELWRKVWAADHSYSVAVHNGCRGVRR